MKYIFMVIFLFFFVSCSGEKALMEVKKAAYPESGLSVDAFGFFGKALKGEKWKILSQDEDGEVLIALEGKAVTAPLYSFESVPVRIYLIFSYDGETKSCVWEKSVVGFFNEDLEAMDESGGWDCLRLYHPLALAYRESLEDAWNEWSVFRGEASTNALIDPVDELIATWDEMKVREFPVSGEMLYSYETQNSNIVRWLKSGELPLFPSFEVLD